MKNFEQKLAGFELSEQQLLQIQNDFCQSLQDSLVGKPSSFKMVSSFLDKPSGHEQGDFLALDFGGTNVRALVVALLGQGRYRIKRQVSRPLFATDGSYNYLKGTTAAEELFGFLVEQIGMVADDHQYDLGYTFSFPCRQDSIKSAVLLHWTKEIKTGGVQGQDVAVLLKKALARKGLQNIQLVAIINDTVGTLLTAAYGDASTDIGSICGTGHNTCYAQSVATGGYRIINLESGNFNQLPLHQYDVLLDQASDKPGEQLLEKMVAGRYLGELCRLVLCDVAEPDCWVQKFIETYQQPYSFTAQDMASFIVPQAVNKRNMIRLLCQTLVRRSARIVGATYAGILQHIDRQQDKEHTITIDGSLYEKMPGYKKELVEVVQKLHSRRKIKVILTKDGSGVGAAIAAASVAHHTSK